VKPETIPVPLRYIGVALLFAICGASSVQFLSWDFPDNLPKLLPIPFAIVCALLFLRTVRVIFAVPLMVLVWPLAFALADFSAMEFHDVISPACIGGLIGGLGLVLCVSVCQGRMFSSRYLLGGAVVGSFSALSFAPWLRSFYSHINGYPSQPLLLLAFAVWQAAVGTYLYAICTHAKDENPQLVGPARTSVRA
jgi:hypothetical protein